jgi:hypothetical protein
MKGALPDVNVLLALAWPNHQFHQPARSWYQAEGAEQWSTCGVTQLGFIRLSSNPAFTPYAKTPLEAVLLLREWTQEPGHAFVGELPATTGGEYERVATRLQGYKQTTDGYLVVVAKAQGLRLVTFDRRVAQFYAKDDLVTLLGP